MLISFNLQDADPDEVMKVLSMITNLKPRVTPAAQPYLRCTLVTIHNPDRVTPQQAIVSAARALRPHGLVLAESPTEIVLDKAPDAPVPPCAKP